MPKKYQSSSWAKFFRNTSITERKKGKCLSNNIRFQCILKYSFSLLTQVLNVLWLFLLSPTFVRSHSSSRGSKVLLRGEHLIFCESWFLLWGALFISLYMQLQWGTEITCLSIMSPPLDCEGHRAKDCGLFIHFHDPRNSLCVEVLSQGWMPAWDLLVSLCFLAL